MIEIDACGLSCPEPVVLLSKALKAKPECCNIRVDNVAAIENCIRFGRHAGYEIQKEADGIATVLRLKYVG